MTHVCNGANNHTGKFRKLGLGLLMVREHAGMAKKRIVRESSNSQTSCILRMWKYEGERGAGLFHYAFLIAPTMAR